MITNSITIPHLGTDHTLKRAESDNNNIQFLYQSQEWRIAVSVDPSDNVRVFITKHLKVAETTYNKQFQYDCDCYMYPTHLSIRSIKDQIKYQVISNATRWNGIKPIIDAIYSQIVEEIRSLHPIDLLQSVVDIEYFIYRRPDQYKQENYNINETLFFGDFKGYRVKKEVVELTRRTENFDWFDNGDGYYSISHLNLYDFLYWLIRRDGSLTITNGIKTKTISK